MQAYPLPPNLVWRCKSGRVFPAGVELDSPSSDAIHRLSTLFSLSVETRRRIDGLRMVFTRCASSELRFCAIREEVARGGQETLMSWKAWWGAAARVSLPWHAFVG